MPSIPQAHRSNPLIDAETTLVGAIAHGALRPAPKKFVSGEVVRLNTKLDAAARFTLVASHSNHTAAVTVDLQLAPLLKDGATGTLRECGEGVAAGRGRPGGGLPERPRHQHRRRRSGAGAVALHLFRQGRGDPFHPGRPARGPHRHHPRLSAMTTTPTASATPIDPRTGWVLLHNGDQEIYVWAVHAGGWQALGWTVGPAPAPAQNQPEQPIEPEDPPQAGGEDPEIEDPRRRSYA